MIINFLIMFFIGAFCGFIAAALLSNRVDDEGWIYTSDMLPHQLQRVLITDGTYVSVGYYSIEDFVFYTDDSDKLSVGIIAWQPLPESNYNLYHKLSENNEKD